MRKVVLCLMGLMLLLGSVNGFAATISLTSPLSDTSVKEGDDYFSDVMQYPLSSFSERRGMYWEENFTDSSINVNGGTWNGTFATAGGYVFPLFAGFPLALNTGRTGQNFPLNGSKYTYLSVMDKVSSSNTNVVYWGTQVDWPDGTMKSAVFDGYYTNTQGIQLPDTWKVNHYNFASTSSWTSSNITAVRLDPSSSGPAGTTVSYAWIRASDPNSAPNHTISWSASETVSPTDSAIKYKVNIYIDSDNSGFDGAFFARATASDGSYTFPTSALPPGTYYFYLKLYNNTDSDTLLATSGYSGKLTVNGKTRIAYSNPSYTSGEDYATAVVGNPWDMHDSSDVANLNLPEYQRQFKDWSFTDGYLKAIAYIPSGLNQNESDDQVWLNIDQNNPIDTSKYRYLTYQMGIDSSNYTNISNKVDKGFLSRVIWWNNGINVDGSETKGNVVYEDTHSYTIDLLGSNILSIDNTFPANTGWRGNSKVYHMRLDPTETSVDTWFYIYDVKLTAPPEPGVGSNFTIQFTTTDKESENASVAFYINSTNSGYNGTLIGSSTFNPGTNSYTFSTSLVPQGEWYIYAVITDAAGNVSYRYADVPIKVGLAVWHDWFAVDTKETPMVGDFNGDGKTDIITFTRDNANAVGDVYVALSEGSYFGSNNKWNDWFAISQDETIVIGDFNGDGMDDIATWLGKSTRQIYVATSFGAGMNESALWLNRIGDSSDDVLKTGDVNGDGYEDLVLFSRNTGRVYVATSNGSNAFNAIETWHEFFAVSTYERPEVGDVDGDGKDDIITFASDSPTAKGDVYVALSTGREFYDRHNSDKWNDWFAVESSQRIRVGDINGDRKDDFATFLPPPYNQVYVVYSQGTGMSDNYLLSSDFPTSSTDQPFIGDVNGDGKGDLIVFTQGSGKAKVRITQ